MRKSTSSEMPRHPTGSTGTPTTFLSNLDHPRGVAFDNAGNLFVATNTSDSSGNIQGTILKITPGGAMSTFATGFGTGFFLQQLALDSAGNLFAMADDPNPNRASTIYKFTPGGTVSTFGSVPGQGRQGVDGLTRAVRENTFTVGRDPVSSFLMPERSTVSWQS